jgi:hypothetical protein
MSSTPRSIGHAFVTLVATTRKPLDFTYKSLKKNKKIMPEKSSTQPQGRKIKHLAKLQGCSPQSYPHIRWTLCGRMATAPGMSPHPQ